MPSPAKPGCFPQAVAAAYGLPYEASLDEERPPDGRPSEEGLQAALRRTWTRRVEWAAANGLEWWNSKVVAPIHLHRWIAGVPSLGSEAPAWIKHVVVMTHDRLWLDPAGVASWLPPELIADEPLRDLLAGGGRALIYREVQLSQVTTAFWLEPKGTGARFETEQQLEGEWGVIGKANGREGAELDAAVVVAGFGDHRAYEIAGVNRQGSEDRPAGPNRAQRRAATRAGVGA